MEGFREQIIELLPRLRRFARTLARDPHDADDLVQVAVERALARADQLRADAPVSSWMFGILRNAWLDEARSRARRSRVFVAAELGENVAHDVAGGISDPRDILSVQDAMQRLPEEQRAAIGLVLVEGLSYKEAAAIMEIPIGTLTSRLARGREALQGMLAGTKGATA